MIITSYHLYMLERLTLFIKNWHIFDGFRQYIFFDLTILQDKNIGVLDLMFFYGFIMIIHISIDEVVTLLKLNYSHLIF